MSAPFLRSIDWERPWLTPLRPIAHTILQSENWRQALNTAAASLQNHRGLPIRFVPQADLPPKISYEAFISDTGQVPTRDNLHDFFNALMWLTFPKTKAQLNALQAAEITKTAMAPIDIPSDGLRRGKIRDAATIFDENAALIITRDPKLVAALRNHEWHHLFITGREAFLHDCEVWLFGHALVEKLVSPYKAITAHARVIAAGNEFFVMRPKDKQAWIDEQGRRELLLGLSTADFLPLPVLGVPGWFENQDYAFYGDTNVFRPKRDRNQ
ncbi:MAG: hypothetical protein A3I66_18245 [Burkholderiales bacterium RIFCSPLOWO2_02_FULL_57_36]|nr:MAG: hypothetical protein A3I66_18245 [Burkholderiales bacterium RIFCSPLOWO2_02_FULL_57_36]